MAHRLLIISIFLFIGGISFVSGQSFIDAHKQGYLSLQEIEGLTNAISVLDVSSNELESIEYLSECCASLLILNAANNRIKHLNGLRELTLLREIDLSGNHLTSAELIIPGSSLRIVNLSGNKLEGFAIDEGSSVLELYAGYNKFKSVPEGIGKMQKLEVLDLSNNKINSLALLEGRRLKHLDLSGNKLSSFDGPVNLNELLTIDLSYNRFGDCPAALAESKALRELNMAYNNLTTLPNWLRHSKIKTLDLSGNPYLNLEQAFEVISKMPALDTLIMREINLLQLPGRIERLFHLDYLDLSGNTLAERDLDEIFRRLYQTRLIY